MLNIFGLVIRTKKEEVARMAENAKMLSNMDQLVKASLELANIAKKIEDERFALAMGAINLRDDIMRLDMEESDWFTVMNLIDKNFGDISEKDKTKTVDIKFGGF